MYFRRWIIFQKLYRLLTEKVCQNRNQKYQNQKYRNQKYQNFQTDVENVKKFWNFWHKNSLFWTIEKSIFKNPLNSRKIFDIFFCERRYNFAKNYQTLKLLPEHTALNRGGFYCYYICCSNLWQNFNNSAQVGTGLHKLNMLKSLLQTNWCKMRDFRPYLQFHLIFIYDLEILLLCNDLKTGIWRVYKLNSPSSQSSIFRQPTDNSNNNSNISRWTNLSSLHSLFSQL